MPDYETVNVIADIIKHEMAIPDAQVAIYNQGVPPPQAAGLFIAIDIMDKEVLGNNTRYESRGDDLWQLQTLQLKEQICINAVSLGTEAHERNHEIVLALGSTCAQQLQEQYSLRISRIPSAFTKVSNGGDATNVNQYTITVATQRGYYKESMVDSFNQFQPVNLITQPANHNSTPP
jgi:hypothetical protein